MKFTFFAIFLAFELILPTSTLAKGPSCADLFVTSARSLHFLSSKNHYSEKQVTELEKKVYAQYIELNRLKYEWKWRGQDQRSA